MMVYVFCFCYKFNNIDNNLCMLVLYIFIIVGGLDIIGSRVSRYLLLSLSIIPRETCTCRKELPLVNAVLSPLVARVEKTSGSFLFRYLYYF